MANGEVAVAPDGFAVGVAKRDAGMSRLVSIVFANYYVDSIMLAKLTAELSELNGIEVASVVMGTPFQHDELKRVGLADDTTRAAGPNDLVMALLAHSSADADVARQHFETALNSRARTGGRHEVLAAQTITQAARRSPDATVAFISVPGMFATVEAHQALVHGLVPVIFSDHVSLDDEVALKDRAAECGLMVLGPDCGTAIIGNLALGFVNEVRRGGIGLIAACGTGAQEVSILIDKEGEGVSHILGVGGRDLSAEVGGRSTLAAINLLALDTATDVIVVLAKQPARRLAPVVIEALERAGKPWTALFLGMPHDDARVCSTLEGVARGAVALCRSTSIPIELLGQLPIDGAGIFGAFQGGTLASEASYILGPNARIVDFGAEEYTTGAPHPMIDPAQRNAAIAASTVDPSVRTILADLVLGHGAHRDPSPALAAAYRAASERAEHPITGHVHVVGTESDPQDFARVEMTLLGAGWTVHPSSTAAAFAAGAGQLKWS